MFVVNRRRGTEAGPLSGWHCLFVPDSWSDPIDTERLRLRPLAMDDEPELHRLQADREAMRFFGGPYVREQTHTWLEWHVALWEQEGYSHWAAEQHEDGAFVGWIGLTRVWEPEELLPAVEVGWFVDRRRWGRGLATEGARGALAYGFDDPGLDRIIARYDPGNVASGRVMEKLGMRHVVDVPAAGRSSVLRVCEIRAAEMPAVPAPPGSVTQVPVRPDQPE
jgi:RimJ/RimL family protein N-acetyltransferase